ncbi:hypothetical protein VTI74DRAFT_4820 [Chaetomium olivicolor]
MANTRQPVAKGSDVAASDLPSFIPTAPSHPPATTQENAQPEIARDSAPLPAPPLMHFPHCRLDITTFPAPDFTSSTGTTISPGKVEQIALPGSLVRTLLSRFEEEPTAQQQSQQQRPASRIEHPRERRVQIQRHFDDNDDWVFSRCLLADFTGFREDEAEVLSSQGRLCCWASVVLQPQQEQQGSGDKWELGFVVQRVGVRDPGSGWCECF